jgi:predicted enzyme related to lactoylglutathione lyase
VDAETPAVVFYMEVPDPQVTLDQVVAAGGVVVVPVTDMGMVTYALFADPEGHVLGIVKAQP